MSENLLALAARCENATGPDRELDADIALTQGWTEHPGDNWIGPFGQIAVPYYTASLDAAVTLVPGPAWWWVEAQPLVHGAYLSGCGDERVARGTTPALALCCAALRARPTS